MQNVSGAGPTETFLRSCNRTRTYNLPVNSRLLCQLSYAGLVHFSSADWLATRPRGDNLSALRGVRANWVNGAGAGVRGLGVWLLVGGVSGAKAVEVGQIVLIGLLS
jgi:hypothetical protein